MGTYCAQGPLCVSDNQGNCPLPQNGLPYGSICNRIATGVYGCQPAPEGTYRSCNEVSQPEESQKANERPPSSHPVDRCSGQYGMFPVSVEGVGTFCAHGPHICVAESHGTCPGNQPGLEGGSYCARLESTGVYGCVASPEADKQYEPEAPSSHETSAEPTPCVTTPCPSSDKKEETTAAPEYPSEEETQAPESSYPSEETQAPESYPSDEATQAPESDESIGYGEDLSEAAHTAMPEESKKYSVIAETGVSTGMSASAQAGIIIGAVVSVSGLLYVTYRIHKARQNREAEGAFVIPTPMEQHL
jgi:hypothetical protein